MDSIYKLVADGYPKVRGELEHRACLKYPVASEVFLVFVRRRQTDQRNDLRETKEVLTNLLTSLAKGNPDLEFELGRAREKGKSNRQIVHQVYLDLRKTQDPGMKEGEEKYIPLIEKKDGRVYLTYSGRELFE